MRTAPQLNAAMAPLVVRIRQMSNAMLTGLDDTNSLKSRPMTPLEIDSAGAIWFFVDLRSATVKRLAVLHLSFSDPVNARYVSISGRGELDVNRQHIEALWNASSIRWFPDGASSTNLALLKFIPERAEYWDAAQSRMVRTFAPSSAYITGARAQANRHRVPPDIDRARQPTPRLSATSSSPQHRYD